MSYNKSILIAGAMIAGAILLQPVAVQYVEDQRIDRIADAARHKRRIARESYCADLSPERREQNWSCRTVDLHRVEAGVALLKKQRAEENERYRLAKEAEESK